MKRWPALLFVLLALVACREETAGPFELSGRVFIFNPRLATATYVVTLRPVAVTGEAVRAIAEFEDPAGGAAIVVEQTIWPKAEKLALESPPVFCIVKDRSYGVAIRIENAAGDTLQRIDTSLLSTLDQSVLPDKPLVVGPAYQPNPELAAEAGGPAAPARTCPVAP